MCGGGLFCFVVVFRWGSIWGVGGHIKYFRRHYNVNKNRLR